VLLERQRLTLSASATPPFSFLLEFRFPKLPSSLLSLLFDSYSMTTLTDCLR